LQGLLGTSLTNQIRVTQDGALVVGTARSRVVASLPLAQELPALADDGFLIRAVTIGGKRATVIAANHDVGLLYGAFAFLRHVQMTRPLASIAMTSTPRVRLRLLDHWDNLDGTVERGYAGQSLWNWAGAEPPDSVSQRYRDYARANASIGINGT